MKKIGTLGLGFAMASLLVGGVPARTAQAQGGGADFTRYVAFGDSLSAGFQSGSLFDGRTASTPINLGQNNAFPVLLADAMDTPIVLPLISYSGLPGTTLLAYNDGVCTLGATTFTPTPGNGTRINPTVPATDVAVPGQSVGEALTVKWSIDPTDLSTINTPEDVILGLPYAFAGAPPKTQIETGVGLAPTFATVWLGSNDALAAARAADATLVTPVADFNAQVDQMVTAIKATNAKVAMANVPDVTVIPHLISQAEVKAITGLDDGQVKFLFGIAKTSYLPLSQLAALSAIVADPTTGPLAPNQILTAKEVKKIRKAVKSYNKKLKAVADANGWAFVDMNTILTDANRNGVAIGSATVTTNYLGGIFSLDGIHPSNTGHAVIASAFIAAINAKYGTSLAAPNVAAVLADDPLAQCVSGTAKAEGTPYTMEQMLRVVPAASSSASIITRAALARQR